ncbi:CDP-glycerol glycerophosphotransferase family protein, partial [Enterococcus faecalis]
IYAYDYEEYLKDRGLLMDFKELPFPFALTEKELLRSIKDFSASDYVKKVRDFKKEHNIYETGHASQDIGNRILLEMKK